jgi:hypothetical protein
VKPSDDQRDVMIAVTFAEAGEWDEARRWAPPPGRGRLWAWIERHLSAAAFAEEGLHAEARRLVVGGRPRRALPPQEDALDAILRARGVRMFSGVLSPAALAVRR